MRPDRIVLSGSQMEKLKRVSRRCKKIVVTNPALHLAKEFRKDLGPNILFVMNFIPSIERIVSLFALDHIILDYKQVNQPGNSGVVTDPYLIEFCPLKISSARGQKASQIRGFLRSKC